MVRVRRALGPDQDFDSCCANFDADLCANLELDLPQTRMEYRNFFLVLSQIACAECSICWRIGTDPEVLRSGVLIRAI